ncbi:transglycosylase SLT domain-containing protein [Thiorhodospira sibirica]|uniref:transglycosylase SLT domain-containing protein n=1 Tax=Thiorhodospira sibirica TaxID=154347 RepID=UPI00022C58DB|nr:transglycosylase SLT domain-containing protein [Thiorhodospira sibirica]
MCPLFVRRMFVPALIVLLTLFAQGIALADPLANQRKLFIEAEGAKARGDSVRYQALLEPLKDYPLLPYLLHDALDARLSQASAAEVRAFLARFEGSMHAFNLRNRWLALLAGRGDWENFLQDYRELGADTSMQCHYRHALLRTGRQAQALDGVEDLWRQGRSQPTACNPVFQAWRADNRLTTALVWERFELALQAGQPNLARYLRRYLSEADQLWADRWLALHQTPEQLAQVTWQAHQHPIAGKIVAHAFERLARRDAQRAQNLYNEQAQRLRLSPQDAFAAQRHIAMRLSLRADPAILPYLAKLPEGVFDSALRGRQARAALAAGDWRTVAMAIGKMSAEDREDAAWRYWQARALEQIGETAQAQALYVEIAQERNYFGFLAAERSNRPYRIGHEALQVSTQTMTRTAAHPAVRSAYEFLALGREVDARREWQYLLGQLDTEGLKAAAILAQQWGWHDRAIFAAARARAFDDIELRFPLAYSQYILDAAAAQEINPAWAMAVARQESAFMRDARSHAGALGLMQIMPATGRGMASHVNVTLNRDLDLIDPDINTRIGTYYLRHNVQNFGGHVILATAAYNAGPGRVRSWLPEHGSMEADVWAELIPFTETRDYVRRVLAYMVLYEVRLGLAPTRLSSLMAPITPRAQLGPVMRAHLENILGPGDAMPNLPTHQICDAPGYVEVPCT